MSKYGIPYRGSKSSIAEKLIQIFPKADNFYDLFGGGFSITHAMILNRPNDYKRFHFNEIDPLMVPLVQDAIAGKYNYDGFKPQFISREDFFSIKDVDGYVKYIWSFGNNGKDYLFSRSIEEYKNAIHNAVVFSELNVLAKDVLGFSVWPTTLETINARRLYVRQKIASYRKKGVPEVLHKFLSEKQLQSLQQLQSLRQLQQLQQLQQLERLQQLEQLQQLQQLQQLTFTALDYRSVNILPNSIVYCDIPYKNTRDYNRVEFDHESFLRWAKEQPFPVFFSEYETLDDSFEEVFMVEKRSLMATTGTNLRKIERVFWNKK